MAPLRKSLGLFAFAGLAGATLLPVAAQAWWRGGVWIGVPPVVVAPPVAAYPPAYYPPYYAPPYYAPPYYAPPYYSAPGDAPGYGAPPPAYPAPQGRESGEAAPESAQAQPQQTPAPDLSEGAAPYGTTCYAGPYTCAAPYAAHVGTGCSCPGIGAPSYGVVQ